MNAFKITHEGMEQVSSLLMKDLVKGLEREGKDVKVKMLITYVHSLPDGSEEGDFLALDLGGSNFRVLLISECYRRQSVRTLISTLITKVVID